MKQRTTFFLIAAIVISLLMQTSAFAFGMGMGMGMGGASAGKSGVGAGVLFPSIDGVETDNTLYYLFSYKATNYAFEVDYFNDADMDGWMMHGDYLYPLTQIMSSEAYVGMGYSYLFGNSEPLGDKNGINICVGLNVQDSIDVSGRYFFLGGGDKILQVGGVYYF